MSNEDFLTAVPDAVKGPIPAPEEPKPKKSRSKKDDILEVVLPQSKPAIPGNLIGRPAKTFSDDERSYIDERLQDFLEFTLNDKRSVTIVNEAIHCDIEMQRIDAKISEIQEKPLNAGLISEIKVFNDHRSTYMKRYTAAMEMLGALPKDKPQDTEEDLCMSDLHKRYFKAIRTRRERGDKIGQPSKEEAELAKSEGLDPKRYIIKGVLSDEERDEICKLTDGVPPPAEEETENDA
jgi:hypothetical protein